MVEEEQITVIGVILVKTENFSWNWFVMLINDFQMNTRNLNSNFLNLPLLLSLTIQNCDLNNLVFLKSFICGCANSSSCVPIANLVMFNSVFTSFNSLNFTYYLFNVRVDYVHCVEEGLNVIVIHMLFFSSSHSIMMLKDTHCLIQSSKILFNKGLVSVYIATVSIHKKWGIKFVDELCISTIVSG